MLVGETYANTLYEDAKLLGVWSGPQLFDSQRTGLRIFKVFKTKADDGLSRRQFQIRGNRAQDYDSYTVYVSTIFLVISKTVA